jgi:uncharacterized protein (DUF1501 family)
MAQISRRNLLIGAGAAVTAGAITVSFDDLLELSDRFAGNDGPILVLVTMYGGNDGLNTVIPYSDNAYFDARPGMSYKPEQVLQLDDQLGLNPAMAGLAEMWKRKELAIVRGVGYPGADRSHFRSMDIWQTATPSDPSPTGWVGRWLDSTGSDPLLAVNIGPVLPRLMCGEKGAAACLDPSSVNDSFLASLSGLSAPDKSDSPSQALVRRAYRSEQSARKALSAAVRSKPKRTVLNFKDQLDLVAQCINAGISTRIYSVAMSGFDTHADEINQQQRLLKQLDTGISSFFGKIKASRPVVMLAYSEFGRRVRANASHGTDHGTAGPVFVLGTGVNGGFYGDQPSLTDLTDGDLKTTTDFRAIYSEMLDLALGADPQQILGKRLPEKLGLLRAT